MIVNKVVLLISPARAREEELISQISRCCLCSATLAAPWGARSGVDVSGLCRGAMEGWGGPVGVRSAASPLFSPSGPEAETLSRR